MPYGGESKLALYDSLVDRLITEIGAVTEEERPITPDLQLLRSVSYLNWYKTTLLDNWQLPKHIVYLCELVQKVIEGEYKRVAVSMPPGHAKSDTITRRLPIRWGQLNPRDAIVLTGYSQRFTETNLSRPCREIAREVGALSASSFAMDEWRLENGSRIVARGVGTPPTGINPISLLVADDPIKDRAQANSEIERNNIWEWWTGSIVQRFRPHTAAFLIATRWHEDDLIGRLKEQNDGDWLFINLPAIAGENDPLGRLPGEALWPESQPLAFLEAQRAAMGDYEFEALYQGNPTPRDGAFFKVTQLEQRILDRCPPLKRKARGWDYSDNSGKGDFSAGVKVAEAEDGRIIIVDAERGKWLADERNARQDAIARLDGEETIIVIPEDPGQAGKEQARTHARRLIGFKVKAKRPTGSKETRADPYAAQVNAGNVWMVRGEWNKPFIEEHRQFPRGKNDDFIDAVVDAFTEVFTPELNIITPVVMPYPTYSYTPL